MRVVELNRKEKNFAGRRERKMGVGGLFFKIGNVIFLSALRLNDV